MFFADSLPRRHHGNSRRIRRRLAGTDAASALAERYGLPGRKQGLTGRERLLRKGGRYQVREILRRIVPIQSGG